MSGLLSAVLDARNNVLEEPWTEQEPITSADELTTAVGDFLDASLTEKIRAVMAFDDANELHPTDASIDVLVAVLFSFGRTDERWGESNFLGSPSVKDYAKDVIDFLRLRYDR